jgi:hypothetical protein
MSSTRNCKSCGVMLAAHTLSDLRQCLNNLEVQAMEAVERLVRESERQLLISKLAATPPVYSREEFKRDRHGETGDNYRAATAEQVGASGEAQVTAGDGVGRSEG